MNTLIDTIRHALTLGECGLQLSFHSRTKEQAAEIAHSIGGFWSKHSSQGLFWLKRELPPSAEIVIFIPGICHRVQTGVTEVAEVPARPAVAAHLEPVYEYCCEEVLE